MANQKQAVMDLVKRHREEGRRISEVLGSLGVARSSYYRWKKGQGEKTEPRQSSYQITEEERRLIEEVKQTHPEYRHRRIQGVLQNQGVYLSASAIYEYLRQRGWVEVYDPGGAVEGAALRGQAAKPPVGMRLEQAPGRRSAVVSFDGDRFLLPTDRCV